MLILQTKILTSSTFQIRDSRAKKLSVHYLMIRFNGLIGQLENTRNDQDYQVHFKQRKIITRGPRNALFAHRSQDRSALVRGSPTLTSFTFYIFYLIASGLFGSWGQFLSNHCWIYFFATTALTIGVFVTNFSSDECDWSKSVFS